jgi:putative DNA primase/helicase
MTSKLVDLSKARNDRANPKTKPSSGTDKIIYDDIIGEIADYYLDEIDPETTGVPAPPASTIKRELINRTNQRFEMININLKGHDRITRLKTMTPSQISRVLIRLHHAVTITAGGLGTNKTYDLIGIYVSEGPNEGIYATGDIQIASIARQYNQEITISAIKEVLQAIREKAPQVERCTRRELTVGNNGIFNYDTDEMMPFTPDLVFTAKLVTPVDATVQSPVYTNPDGTTWEVVEWVNSLSPDPEVVKALWQVIGAIVRPHVRWGKTAWFYSENGNNGKGTLCHLMRSIVGEASCASLPLADFGKDFMLEPLTQAMAIIVDENDVGIYLDKVANLKAVVTNDVVSINRKGLVPINYRFWGFMVQCLNEFPQVRDRSQSFYRRQLFIPFTQNFQGIERRYIKDDYLQRPEVLKFVLKHVLMDLPKYYELDEPEATKQVLDRYKEANDPVREFWNEHESVFTWDLLPFVFLYDHYKSWFSKNNPSGKVLGKYKFTDNLIQVVGDSSIWYCQDKTQAVRTGDKMLNAEYLIQQYELNDWKAKDYGGKDIRRMCTPSPALNYRGLQRYLAGSANPTSDHDSDEQ